MKQFFIPSNNQFQFIWGCHNLSVLDIVILGAFGYYLFICPHGEEVVESFIRYELDSKNDWLGKISL